MRVAWLALAACAAKQPPVIEHRAAPPATETFVLDAPLFTTEDVAPVMWTFTRDGENAHLALGDREYTGTAQRGDPFHADLGGVTMDCRRTEIRAHIAGAKPATRAPHAACSVPRTWQPADTVTTQALTCTVHRDKLTTEVTMAAAPGLQAVVDDCCDDEDRCERRWEIRRRYTTAELRACADCPCYDELYARVATCQLPADARSAIGQAHSDVVASLAEAGLDGSTVDRDKVCTSAAKLTADRAAAPCGWSATP